MLAMVLVGGAVLMGCSGPQRNTDASDKRYQLAADLFHRGDVDAAEVEAKKALALDPQSTNVLELLGDIALFRAAQKTRFIEIDQCAQGQEAADYESDRDARLREAEDWFGKAVAIEADDARALDNWGVAALNLKDWETVLKVDKQAIGVEYFPGRQLALGDLGWAYYQKGDLLHALEQLKIALSQDPDFCVGRYRLAEVYYAQGNLADATAAAEAVDAKLATCPIQENERLLGVLRVKQGDLRGAAAFFKKCQSFSPRSCVAADCARYLDQVGR